MLSYKIARYHLHENVSKINKNKTPEISGVGVEGMN